MSKADKLTKQVVQEHSLPLHGMYCTLAVHTRPVLKVRREPLQRTDESVNTAGQRLRRSGVFQLDFRKEE